MQVLHKTNENYLIVYKRRKISSKIKTKSADIHRQMMLYIRPGPNFLYRRASLSGDMGSKGH